MSRKLGVAVLSAIALNVLITGYGALAAREEAQAVCVQDHGTVHHHDCMRDGHVLFSVPL